jgi:hypothetical protein
MEKTKIVGVCSANVERSATFDAVINDELAKQKIIAIDVSSAGINVEKILANTSALKIQINILNAGLHYGLVRNEIRKQVEAVVEKGEKQEHTDEIRALYAQIRPLVHGYNLALRNLALQEAGISNFPAPYTKFEPGKGFDLVLPMAEKDIGKVAERYEKLNMQQPRIMTYGVLVGVNEKVDNVGGGLQGARNTVQYFMDTRKFAVSKMLELRL